MKTRLQTQIFTFFLVIAYNAVLFAQDDDIDPHPGDDDELPNAVPIDNLMIWLLVIGIVFAFFIYRKQMALPK
jgi:hypothetical protein